MAGTFLFNDGNAGHLCDMGSAPAVGETDILCINSDTVITAVASSAGAAWVLAESSVNAQGSYIYYRKATGGEPTTFTVTTTGNFNTHVGWSRWPSLNALDTSTNTQASSANVITPVHSTGVMTESTELVIAFGALHAIGTANQNTPIWSTGFLELTSSAAQGTAGSGVRGYVGYKQNAGTAAEAPRVQWSGDNVTDRYMLTVSFTTIGAAANVPAGVAAGTGAANNAALALGVSAGLAAGAGVSNPATLLVSPSVGVSAGVGAALDASINITATSSAGVAAGVGAALDPSISIEMEGDVHLYKFGPCEPWDPIWNCNISLITGAAEVTGVAIQAASEILYQLSAQRFGLCDVKLRPCRKSCQGGFPWWSWWEYGSYPQPYWWNGTWYNLACGSCPGDSCSCISLSETELPGPVAGITEVKLNGVVLTAGVDYRVDDYRKLVSLGDPWPYCQDLRLEDTEPNTWSVTAEYGEIVPVIGRMAVGELGLEFVKYLTCADDCQLPFGVVDVSRQGISMTIQNTAELIKQGIINLPMCAMFIQASNPEHLTARAAVYDLDAPSYRAVGT